MTRSFTKTKIIYKGEKFVKYKNKIVTYNIPEDGTAVYIAVCPECGRFVKADESFNSNGTDVVNATCKKCGRVKMPFEGIF